MLYEDSEVRPTANLELFNTSLLKYISELTCFYIVIVKGKVTESIPLTRVTCFTISPFGHFNILTSYHYIIYNYTIASLKTQNHFCSIV